MTTLLVTGGAGFIGSNFVIYILRKYPNYKVINLDKLTYAGNLENLLEVEDNPNYEFIHGDICNNGDVESIFQRNEIDYIINFAAESHVDNSILDPELFIRTNVLGTTNLLNIAKKYWETKDGFRGGKKFIQISTDEVYGSLGTTGLFSESSPVNPHSPYSASKASADMIVKAYYDTFNMPINITRCSNNYGPYQFPEKLIPLMINNALNKKHLPLYGDGLNVRDWLYVEDHLRAIDIVIHNGSSGEIYNIGGNNERTNLEIVNKIIGYLKKNVDESISETLLKNVEDRKGHDKRYGIDASKMRREMGWYPLTSFEEGIDKTIRWYLDNRKWAKNIATAQSKILNGYFR